MTEEIRNARKFMKECNISERPSTARTHLETMCDVAEKQQKRIDAADELLEASNKIGWPLVSKGTQILVDDLQKAAEKYKALKEQNND